VNTSVPIALRDAAPLAAGMGFAESVTELTVARLRQALEVVAQRAVLDAHDEPHPHARPSLAEIAVASAELDGNPLAAQPALIRRAAREVAALKRDPDADDVLLCCSRPVSPRRPEPMSAVAYSRPMPSTTIELPLNNVARAPHLRPNRQPWVTDHLRDVAYQLGKFIIGFSSRHCPCRYCKYDQSTGRKFDHCR